MRIEVPSDIAIGLAALWGMGGFSPQFIETTTRLAPSRVAGMQGNIVICDVQHLHHRQRSLRQVDRSGSRRDHGADADAALKFDRPMVKRPLADQIIAMTINADEKIPRPNIRSPTSRFIMALPPRIESSALT